jgi:hypothetical protein
MLSLRLAAEMGMASVQLTQLGYVWLACLWDAWSYTVFQVYAYIFLEATGFGWIEIFEPMLYDLAANLVLVSARNDEIINDRIVEPLKHSWSVYVAAVECAAEGVARYEDLVACAAQKNGCLVERFYVQCLTSNTTVSTIIVDRPKVSQLEQIRELLRLVWCSYSPKCWVKPFRLPPLRRTISSHSHAYEKAREPIVEQEDVELLMEDGQQWADCLEDMSVVSCARRFARAKARQVMKIVDFINVAEDPVMPTRGDVSSFARWAVDDIPDTNMSCSAFTLRAQCYDHDRYEDFAFEGESSSGLSQVSRRSDDSEAIVPTSTSSSYADGPFSDDSVVASMFSDLSDFKSVFMAAFNSSMSLYPAVMPAIVASFLPHFWASINTMFIDSGPVQLLSDVGTTPG